MPSNLTVYFLLKNADNGENQYSLTDLVDVLGRDVYEVFFKNQLIDRLLSIALYHFLEVFRNMDALNAYLEEHDEDNLAVLSFGELRVFMINL